MIDWNDIRYFLAVAQTGSLSAAARELRVSQPTVGRRIREFEDQLGARLFERASHGYVLSESGMEIMDLAQAMAQEASAIERRVGGENTQFSGIVRLTTTEGLANYWLAKRLPRFRARYPQIEIELIVGELLFDLHRLEADIALRIGTPGSEELVGRRLGRIGCGLYASNSYLQERGEPATLDELAEHTIIESIGELAHVKQVLRLRELARIVSVGLRSNSMLTQIAAVQNGIGILPLPHYAASGAMQLRHILPEEFEVQIDLWLLTRRDLKRTGRIRAVRDFIIEEARCDVQLLADTDADGTR